jgi:hypothetical protein
MEVNPKITNIPINAANGALTAIVLTIMASKVEVMEDPAYNGGELQGLTGYYADTQPATGFPQSGALQVWLPNNNGQTGRAYQPIIFGGSDGRVHGGEGNYVGAEGTIVLYLTTNSANPGGIILVEWP